MSTQGGQELSEAVKSALRTPVLLTAGMSGAERSTVLKIFEDIGYQRLDRLPASLMPALINSAAADAPAIAVGADSPSRGVAAATTLANLAHVLLRGGRCVVLIDCDDDRRERRYTEIQRPHPLAGDRPITNGIRRERRTLPALRDRADLLIDTPALTAEPKRLPIWHFAPDAAGPRVFVASFAYRHAAD